MAPGPLGLASGTKVASVTHGENYPLTNSTTGDLYAWGINEHNLLGISFHEENVFGTPPRLTCHTRVAAGRRHPPATDSQGDVWGWGVNARGQLAIDLCESENITKTSWKAPGMCKCIPTLDDSLLLSEDGRVLACGRYDGGRLGLSLEARGKHARGWYSIFTPRGVQFPFSNVRLGCGTRGQARTRLCQGKGMSLSAHSRWSA